MSKTRENGEREQDRGESPDIAETVDPDSPPADSRDRIPILLLILGFSLIAYFMVGWIFAIVDGYWLVESFGVFILWRLLAYAGVCYQYIYLIAGVALVLVAVHLENDKRWNALILPVIIFTLFQIVVLIMGGIAFSFIVKWSENARYAAQHLVLILVEVAALSALVAVEASMVRRRLSGLWSKQALKVALVVVGSLVLVAIIILVLDLAVFNRPPSGQCFMVSINAENDIPDEAMEEMERKVRDRLDCLELEGITIDFIMDDMLTVTAFSEEDESERVRELLSASADVQFRIVEDEKPVLEIADDNPEWTVTEGEENLVPDAEIILPYSEDETDLLLKLGPTVMTGDMIKKAQLGYGEDGSVKINFELYGDARSKFGEITTENVGKRLAIVLDYSVKSAPNIKEPITDGRGEITGDFSTKEAEELAAVLNSGRFPVNLGGLPDGLEIPESLPSDYTEFE